MRVVLLLLVVIAIIGVSEVSAEIGFRPHDNKHHVYKTCGEYLSRRVTFLCNGGHIREEILSTLDCCFVGCTDRQLFSWCDV